MIRCQTSKSGPSARFYLKSSKTSSCEWEGALAK
jgi:hypothetical protein